MTEREQALAGWGVLFQVCLVSVRTMRRRGRACTRRWARARRRTDAASARRPPCLSSPSSPPPPLLPRIVRKGKGSVREMLTERERETEAVCGPASSGAQRGKRTKKRGAASPPSAIPVVRPLAFLSPMVPGTTSGPKLAREASEGPRVGDVGATLARAEGKRKRGNEKGK